MSGERIEFHGGRVPAPDARDANYPARLLLAPIAELLPRGIQPGTRYYPTGDVLNQLKTGTCVGHGVASVLLDAPIMTRHVADLPPDLQPFAIYDDAIAHDEFPQNDGDVERQFGTSVRAGIEVARRKGRIASYLWADDVDESIAWHVAGLGCALVGMDWRSGMMETDADGFVADSGDVEGGHCFKTTGYSLVRRAFRCKQSWGRRWGQNGYFWLPEDALGRQLADGTAEVCLPTEIRVEKVAA